MVLASGRLQRANQLLKNTAVRLWRSVKWCIYLNPAADGQQPYQQLHAYFITITTASTRP